MVLPGGPRPAAPSTSGPQLSKNGELVLGSCSLFPSLPVPRLSSGNMTKAKANTWGEASWLVWLSRASISVALAPEWVAWVPLRGLWKITQGKERNH